MNASIQLINSVEHHNNADSLDVCGVLGFKAITKRDQWKVGDICCYIMPDCVTPIAPWSEMYRKRSSRTKAIKLRGVWSEGIIESLSNVGYTGPIEVGREISADIGVTHYEPPLPQELNAKGLLPFGIPKTDEHRIETFLQPPFGETVDIMQKCDGQSCSFYWHYDKESSQVHEGVLGRTMEYKLDAHNKYTQNAANLDVLNKLSYFCRKHKMSLCVRGESYGAGIQSFVLNPHSKLNLGWGMFSVWLIEERRYARKGDPFYFLNIAEELRLPTVPVLERDVILTPELVDKYRNVELLNGSALEGVVAQWRDGSCKILSRYYDSKK